MSWGSDDDNERAKKERYDRACANHTELEVDKLFKALIKLKANELRLEVAQPPRVCVRGSLKPLNRPPVFDEELERLYVPMMDERNRRIFEETGAADFAYCLPFEGEVRYFRVNLLRQSGSTSGCVARRLIEEQEEGME